MYKQVETKKLDCENRLYEKYACDLYSASLDDAVAAEMNQMMISCKDEFAETLAAAHRCAYMAARDDTDELRTGFSEYCPEAMGCNIKTYSSVDSCQSSSMLVLDQIGDYAPDCVHIYGQVMNEDLKAYREAYKTLGCNAYRVYAYDIDYSEDKDYEIAENVQNAVDKALSPQGKVYHEVLDACLDQ